VYSLVLLVSIWWKIVVSIDDAFTLDRFKSKSKRKLVPIDKPLPREFLVDMTFSKVEHQKRSTNNLGRDIKVRINGGKLY
jgi:hypothetical protein